MNCFTLSVQSSVAMSGHNVSVVLLSKSLYAFQIQKYRSAAKKSILDKKLLFSTKNDYSKQKMITLDKKMI